MSLNPLRLLLFAALVTLLHSPTHTAAAGLAHDAAAAMHGHYHSVRAMLDDNAFDQPLHLTSGHEGDHTQARLSAVLEHPFDAFAATFKSPDNWCELMMLHLNIKYCAAHDNGRQQMLTVYVGRKHEQPLESAHRAEYAYRVVANGPDYLKIALEADKGPFRTRNYQIVLEAVPLDAESTFIHFGYSYDFGSLAKTAQAIYFRTVGRDKVGFTKIADDNSRPPEYVGGARGALERNIMRYYLALQAYLNGLAEPAPQRLDKRLEGWFALTERYPLQLHEIERDAYLRMKQREFERQRTGAEVLSPAGAVW
ncbi:hypothetical protein [Desulfatitalea alkaliphila]|uniref:Uncharacterized protein n=1 Tax=Desulfatitalea alkaliphila TaxID=2929485 RepID=A0AA41R2H9_9BACT|nr:hypothetical protein [Desulfatitalea alkaliphila]MCJ8501559.1 hypothetical protein [Desulfatitalea alkaliphila]